MKRAFRPRRRATSSATSTSKPRTFDGSDGSASTNGAPPSASPPQRSSAARGGAAYEAAAKAARASGRRRLISVSANDGIACAAAREESKLALMYTDPAQLVDYWKNVRGRTARLLPLVP